MSSCKSSSKASAQTHPSLSLSQRSGMRWWTIYLDEQTNTACSKMMFVQWLSRSWSQIVQPSTTRQETLSPQPNWGKLARCGMANNNKIRRGWPPSISHMTNSSRWSVIYSNSGGQSLLRQIRPNRIETEGVPIIKITTIPPSNVRVSTTWQKK